MSTQIVSLAGERASRLHLYAGFLDPVNGLSQHSDIENALKFAALFYDRIIAPDGFFHGYSPLSLYLREVADSPEAARSVDTVL